MRPPIDRIYMICFAVNNANLFNFEMFLKADPLITGYWNYIPLVYCIKSPLDSTQLTQRVYTHIPGGNFIVAELNVTNINGSLPNQAWEWFYTGPNPNFRNVPSMITQGNINK